MDFPDIFAERLETYTSLIFRKDKIYTHPKVVATAQNEHDLLDILFQHTAARRRLQPLGLCNPDRCGVSTHSRAEAAALIPKFGCNRTPVSTHSRPKAAADKSYFDASGGACFNTQPRGGGCIGAHNWTHGIEVSTHSHPKVAAVSLVGQLRITDVSTHNHPKVAADLGGLEAAETQVSTHSHPKAAAGDDGESSAA